MATLEVLKRSLREIVPETTGSLAQKLSDTQYDDGFQTLMLGSERRTYQDFVIPQLSLLLDPLFNSRICISVLEIGPGPESILGSLPGYLRRKVTRYAAVEPNYLFATRLQEWLRYPSEKESPLPSLESSPEIHRVPFRLESDTEMGPSVPTSDDAQKFDVILFCHSMYGMSPKRQYIEKALEKLVTTPEGGMVVVVHRDGPLVLDGLTCHRTASFPTGVVSVEDNDKALNCFAQFISGFVMQDLDAHKAVQAEWRRLCRSLGRRETARPNQLFFSSPNIIATFTRHATASAELTAHVPVVCADKSIKNREARIHHPASIVKPKDILHVQQCVRWALRHGVSLTVVGGGHSGHCLWPNVVAVDMGIFDQVHILPAKEDGASSDAICDPLVVVESGSKSGDVIRKTMAAGLTVPLGARPSVGAGLWLQGGIGHLARLHGLACDSIVGAIMISVASGDILCVGNVPRQHQPAGVVHLENDADLLWGLKGAGTNFGIVISVTFKAYVAPKYSIQNWLIPLNDRLEARCKLREFDNLVAKKLPQQCSADAYLYCEAGKLRLAVSMFESMTSGSTSALPPSVLTTPGLADHSQTVDGVGLFETEIYMSAMHGGHSGGKTSSFKRCLFLKGIGAVDVAEVLMAAIETRPSPRCYLHLLQGGGAIGDAADDATAFGCRDWDFACVVTGVWRRDEDETEIARSAVQWVYNVARDLLPLSTGAYSADLGPDPRDAALAAKAFGPNLLRLSRLKYRFDPCNVLTYACPLPRPPIAQKLIVLVTGESCAGKDYCAEIWVSIFTTANDATLKARAVSISESTKRDYAAATGANLQRLLDDRDYKEQHRPALSKYFHEQVRLRPRLPEEHFLNVVNQAGDVNVLFITGMRDEAPVAALSHLVPDSRVLEVKVRASRETRRARRGCGNSDKVDGNEDRKDGKNSIDCRSLVFNNDTTGDEAVKRFGDRYLLPLIGEDLQQLADMVRRIPNFPRQGIEFRDVLGISQKLGGLGLCASLLQTQFAGDWTKVNAVVCCETGGFVFASVLAAQVNVPLALIREAGKLPPPTSSTMKSPSHISSSTPNNSRGKSIEMGRDVVPRGASVVVVDDVLATGETLCAVLQLLGEAGIDANSIDIMIVAEFPTHCGRKLLHQRGFGGVKIQSLLVFGGD